VSRRVGFADDLRACLALRDQRARENAAARARMMANHELVAALAAAAELRGEQAIDWPAYFRELGVSLP
jgi:hypothetical protein